MPQASIVNNVFRVNTKFHASWGELSISDVGQHWQAIQERGFTKSQKTAFGTDKAYR